MSEGDSHESDILFCPFCGDVDALEVQHLEGAILYPAYRVACDNCGAAFAIRSDIDEWNTRALPAVQPMTVQETARCEYCDGTGDVHAIDGEWRGYCSCGAGATIRALPAVQPDAAAIRETALREAAAAAWAVEGGDRWTRSAAQSAILALIDRPATKGDWQPIETAPKDGEPVIIGSSDTGFVTLGYWDSNQKGWWEINNDPYDHWGAEIQPTHWMPKPDKPAAKGGDA